MVNHSRSRHLENSLYFDTDIEQQIISIIKEILANPDSFIYQNTLCALKLAKTFSQEECQSLIGQDYIGIDRKNKMYTRRAVICFGSKAPLSKKENTQFWNGGAVMMAFPEY